MHKRFKIDDYVSLGVKITGMLQEYTNIKKQSREELLKWMEE